MTWSRANGFSRLQTTPLISIIALVHTIIVLLSYMCTHILTESFQLQVLSPLSGQIMNRGVQQAAKLALKKNQ